jgi:hypothetical protein
LFSFLTHKTPTFVWIELYSYIFQIIFQLKTNSIIMKKLMLLGFALLGLFVASCQQDTLAPTTSADEVSFTSAAHLGVSPTDTGKCKGVMTKIDLTTLPTSVGTYVTANYTGYTIDHAHQDASGNYLITIVSGTTRKGLLFDSAGVFKQELALKVGKGGNLTVVAIANLPTAITTYISATHVGYTIKHAGTDTTGNYVVHIVDAAGTTNKGLLFTSAGVFTQEVTKNGKGGKKSGH